MNASIAVPQLKASRLPYAPSWLPDELLYSWIGRLASLNALGAPRDCAECIFGSRKAALGIDLPSQLQSIRQRLGHRSPLETVDELLEKGTLLSYHRPFLTSSCYQLVRDAMTHGDGKGLKTLMGRVANRFGANPPLRACADCDSESLAAYGTPYWLRRHQLPGVSCCTSHRIRLKSQSPLSLRTDRQRFVLPAILASADYCRIEADKHQLRFAEMSEELLSAQLPCLDPQHRATTYGQAAREMGFTGRHGRTDCRALAQAVRTSFEDFEGFEHRDRLLAPTSQPLGWVRDLIERAERAVHPICHLLLIDFLFGSVASFATALVEHPRTDPVATRLTSPPRRVPSTNPTLCEEEEEALLRNPTISCRQVASRMNKSVTTVVTLRRARGVAISERRKTLDDVRLQRIRCDLAHGNVPSKVASRCGVSLSTVYRVRAQERALHPPLDEGAREQEVLAERKRRWDDLLSLHPHDAVDQLRAAAPADYAWLYRHDRAWLLSTTQPRRRAAGPTGTRLDWHQRDAELCLQAREHVAALRRLLPPQRVTKTQLLRPLGESLVRANWEQLPRLRALLDEVSESREEFAMRRIDHAITVVADARGGLTLWRVKRQAGLRLWSYESIRYAAQQIEAFRGHRPLAGSETP